MFGCNVHKWFFQVVKLLGVWECNVSLQICWIGEVLATQHVMHRLSAPVGAALPGNQRSSIWWMKYCKHIVELNKMLDLEMNFANISTLEYHPFFLSLFSQEHVILGLLVPRAGKPIVFTEHTKVSSAPVFGMVWRVGFRKEFCQVGKMKLKLGATQGQWNLDRRKIFQRAIFVLRVIRVLRGLKWRFGLDRIQLELLSLISLFSSRCSCLFMSSTLMLLDWTQGQHDTEVAWRETRSRRQWEKRHCWDEKHHV